VDGEEAVARSADADLVVLDLMLPKMGGIEVCRQIRSRGDVPIIMLTAKTEETDTLVGLGVGADDYMTKPFSPRELVARVQAVLRRTQDRPRQPGDIVQVGRLRINPQLRTVERDGHALDLTAREFEL